MKKLMLTLVLASTMALPTVASADFLGIGGFFSNLGSSLFGNGGGGGGGNDPMMTCLDLFDPMEMPDEFNECMSSGGTIPSDITDMTIPNQLPGNETEMSAVPVLPAFWMFCSGILGLTLVARRKL